MDSKGDGLRRCVIIGGGGHARMVIEAMRLQGTGTPYAILDLDVAKVGNIVLEVPVLGGDELLSEMKNRGVESFTVGVGEIRPTGVRERLFDRAHACGLYPQTVVHPRAIVSKWASIEDGVQLLPGCIVNNGVVVEANSIINSGAIVEHDCRIGAHAHVAPGSCLCGGVKVGLGAHVGAIVPLSSGACAHPP